MAITVIKAGGSVMGKRGADGALPRRQLDAIATQVTSLAARNPVVLVVSAFNGETDALLAEVKRKYTDDNQSLKARRYRDRILCMGEASSCKAMTRVLKNNGVMARAFLAKDVPFYTDDNHGHAKIKLDISGENLWKWINDNPDGQAKIAVVAGFQGFTEEMRLTTLGRGGSDYSATAAAAILKRFSETGEQVTCRFIKDEGGVYSADPKIEPNARLQTHLSYDELFALSVAGGGAQLIQSEALVVAKEYNIPLYIGPLAEQDDDFLGTWITAEQGVSQGVIGVTCHTTSNPRDFATVSLVGWNLGADVGENIQGILADASISINSTARLKVIEANDNIGVISVTMDNNQDVPHRAVRAIHRAFDLAA